MDERLRGRLGDRALDPLLVADVAVPDPLDAGHRRRLLRGAEDGVPLGRQEGRQVPAREPVDAGQEDAHYDGWSRYWSRLHSARSPSVGDWSRRMPETQAS